MAALAGATQRVVGRYSATGTRGRGCNPIDYSLPPAGAAPVGRRVIFFVGDSVAGIPEADADADVRRLSDPAHLARALLPGKFGGATACFVVRPADYHAAGFALWQNFLQRTTALGDPLGYRPRPGDALAATRHLIALLQPVGAAEAQRGDAAASADATRAASAPGTPTVLVGFSKGGVVLPVNILRNTFFRSNALHCTATARVLIPAECSAIS